VELLFATGRSDSGGYIIENGVNKNLIIETLAKIAKALACPPLEGRADGGIV